MVSLIPPFKGGECKYPAVKIIKVGAEIYG